MLDFAVNKSFWERVRTSDEFIQHREELFELYKSAFKTEPRSHSHKDILENNDGGLWRLQFDQLQSSALMSLIYPENQEYYENLLKIVWAYLDEYAWGPLGHFSEYYYGKTPADFDNGLIDIFAASVGLSMAEVKNLFKDRFPRLLQDRISHEIRRHIIDPYLTRRFFWESHNNNWTAVCTGAVASTLIYEAPELYYKNQERIHRSMKCYLDSYKSDGMCVEGVGYWSFGFGFFATYAMLERELTNGEFDWFKDEKVKEISKFLQKTFLDKDIIVTYSDTSVKQTYSVGLPHMLRHIYGDEIEPLTKGASIVVKDNTHFNFALRSFIYYSESNIADEIRKNVTYSVIGSNYFVKRTSEYGFSAKGGTNGESHNHIDVGTFILARNNKQIICDVGAGPYEEGYHTDKRYTFFHPSAFAHCLPIINGIGQNDRATDEDAICVYDKENENLSIEIGPAYRLDYLKSLNRSFKFGEREVTLKDTYIIDGENEIKERFVSLIEPKIVGDVVKIDDVSLKNPKGIMPNVTIKEVKAHMSNIGKHNVYLIDYIVPKGDTTFTLEITM